MKDIALSILIAGMLCIFASFYFGIEIPLIVFFSAAAGCYLALNFETELEPEELS